MHGIRSQVAEGRVRCPTTFGISLCNRVRRFRNQDSGIKKKLLSPLSCLLIVGCGDKKDAERNGGADASSGSNDSAPPSERLAPDASGGAP